MATFERRGRYWRVRVRRRGYPEQTRTFDSKAQAEVWARTIEGEMDRGLYLDRTEAEKNPLSDIMRCNVGAGRLLSAIAIHTLQRRHWE
jgi:hypothetical protein